MQEALTLALDFLDEHPDVAARILEQHAAQQVAAFFETVPENYAVLAIARTLPAYAAQLCREFGVEMTARLLLQQDIGRMVAVLRQLERAEVDAILNECPKARRQACSLLLHYPVRCVGAWIVPDVAVVSSDFTLAEVMNFLKAAHELTCTTYVYVVSREGLPEGRISHLALVQGQADQRVEWLMDRQIETLPAQLAAAQAAKLACWNGADEMPVVGAAQQFIGVLRHADLRHALRQDLPRAQHQAASGDPLAGMLDAYGQALLAVFGTVSSAVESELKT